MLVGAGFGETHLGWLTECTDASVEVLGYQKNKARALDLAERYGVPQVSDDPIQAIADGGIDALAVVSPPDTHEALISAGLEAGLLVFSDKPLASSAQATALLVERAKAAANGAFVTFQWRVNPGLRRLREVCAQGDLGTVVRVDLEFHHDFLAGPTTAWPWRHRRETAGAGTLGDQGVHMFDLLGWLAPGAWSVVAGTSSVAWPRRSHEGGVVECETEDIADVLLADTDGPARARVLVSRVSAGRRALRVVVHGTKGYAVLSANPDSGSATLTVVTGEPLAPSVTNFGPHSMNPYEFVLTRIARGVEMDSTGVADFSAGHAAQLLLEEALERGCGNPGIVQEF
ncbi:Gfo/Idh/MocA family protein [Kitasatospora sp. HPMI-4]|uniref:Gfo/Idh/MocA family protein n=1 Tax=Kitasatospora sp. HPMI-4 TaxID=3448443 RepID=UPI003F1C3497